MQPEIEEPSLDSFATAASPHSPRGSVPAGPPPRRFANSRWTVTLTLVLTVIAGLCFGFITSRGWIMRVEGWQQAFAGWPRPRALDWTTAFLVQQRAYLPLAPAARLVGWLAGLGALGLLARSLSANVPFIISSPHSEGHASDWMRIWVDPRLAFRGALALVFSCWVFGAPRYLIEWEPQMSLVKRTVFGGARLLLTELPFANPLLVHWLTSTVITSLAFVAWSSDGFLAPTGFRLPGVARAAGLGAVAGTALAVATMPFTILGTEYVRDYLRASGPARAATEHAILGAIIGPPLCAAALALGVMSLSKLPGARALRLAALAAIALVAGLQAAYYRVVLVDRLDFRKELQGVVRLKSASSRGRRLAILINNRSRCPSARVEYHTKLELDYSDEGVRRVEEFLRRRRYQSRLADDAFDQLLEGAALSFDRERALRACLDNLAGNPKFRIGAEGRLTLQAADLISEMLTDLAPTPVHRKLLEQLCENRTFSLDGAYRMYERLGEAWMRLGDVDRAERFYESAGLNQFRIELQRRQLAVRHGRVTGKVLIGNQPARATQVGVVSTLKWLTLIGSPLSPPNAFSLRTVCKGTRTDADGRFEIDHLGAGQYFLVLLFTPEQVRPEDEVEVENQPGVISIPPDHFRDVGVIRVKPAPASAPRGKEQSI